VTVEFVDAYADDTFSTVVGVPTRVDGERVGAKEVVLFKETGDDETEEDFFACESAGSEDTTEDENMT